MSKSSKFFTSIVAVAMVFLVTIGFLLLACTKSQSKGQKEVEVAGQTVNAPLVEAVEPRGDGGDFKGAVVKVAEQAMPAVVHIEVTERQEVANPFSPFQGDPFFQYFFNIPQAPRKFKRELKGVGTGMIIDGEGNILTNNHVAGGATKIKVVLASGKSYGAKLVGADPKTDLAVIKIDASEPLSHVTFGNSDKVSVGEWVVAIGSPRGLDQTVTHGIISAKHRQGITDPSSYEDFLQTDAAINPGNSGGPLLSLAGEVIGVNSAIVSQSGGFEGIGFAIPSNMALHVAKALTAHGKVERGWLGVSVQDVTNELAQSFGLKEAKGALLAEVAKGGPAEKGGLKRGDVVLTYRGKEVTDASVLRNEVASTAVGEEVKVGIWRDGKREEVVVKAGSQEELQKELRASLKERLGAEVRAVTEKEAEKYRLGSAEGVVVEEIDPKGALGEAGFEEGDLMLAINGQRIATVESLVEMMSAIPSGQKVMVLAVDHRSGNSGYVGLILK